MNKKELAKIFFGSFRTDIKKITADGVLDGIGGDAKARKCGEVIFGNYSQYGKKDFNKDYTGFAKNLGKAYGVDWHEIKKPIDKKGRYKSFYYQWDPEQIIEIDNLKFRMGRKMMNMPHAVLDGVSHTYYITINDFELLDEIKRLNDERLAEIEMKKKAAWPVTVSNAKKQCQEMIDKLNKVLEDGYEFSEDAIRRIRDGHFDICTMMR